MHEVFKKTSDGAIVYVASCADLVAALELIKSLLADRTEQYVIRDSYGADVTPVKLTPGT